MVQLQVDNTNYACARGVYSSVVSSQTSPSTSRARKQPTENLTSSMTQHVCNFYGCHAVWIQP